jgi:hypothetical protein
VNKFLIGIIILLALSTAGGITWACLTPPKPAPHCIALDLRIRQGTPWESWKDDVVSTWSMTNMKPGDATSARFIQFKKEGLICASKMKLTCNYTGTDAMAKEMVITRMYYSDVTFPLWNIDLLTSDGWDTGYTVSQGENGLKVRDVDGDGKISLYDLKYSGGIDNLKPCGLIEVTQLEMIIQFDPDAGNEFQGKSLVATFLFTLY